MAGRILFRGDDRTPTSGANIFANGFSRRSTDDPTDTPIHYRRPTIKAGDITPDTAVCVSARFECSTMFPLKWADTPKISWTYIYVVYVETSEIFNTHGRQVTDCLDVHRQVRATHGTRLSQGTADALAWPVFAHELATLEIPADQIISALACKRNWSGDTWQKGGSYELHTTVLNNPACKVNEVYVNPARSFLFSEIKGHRTGGFPTGVGAMKPSEPYKV